MSTAQWILFCLELLFKYGPKLIKLGREIVEWIEDHMGTDESDVKRNEFNEQLVMESPGIKNVDLKLPTEESMDEFREKICQRAFGRKWVSKDLEDLGEAVAWRKRYIA